VKTTSITAVFAALALAAGACGGGSSGPCAEGATRCAGTSLQTCTDGAFTATADCSETGQVCATDPASGASQCALPPTPECEVGAQGCLVDIQRECGADGWSEVTDCALDGQTCVQLSATAATCLPQCQEDDQRCVPDENTVQTCVQGGWVETDRCTVSDRLCIPSSFSTAECRRDCDEGLLRCNDDTVEECHYVWTPKTVCGADQLCHDDGAGAVACLDKECDSGDTRCSGALRQRCEDALWVTDVDCAAELGAEGVCRPAESGGLECALRECSGTAGRCADNAVEVCTNGFWQETEACGDAICVVDGETASCKTRECDNGDTRCDGADLQTCVDAFWGAPSGCGTGNACRVEGETAACTPFECEGSGARCGGTATVERCTGGFWEPEDTCDGAERCLVPTGGEPLCAVPCTPNEERCGDTGVESCGADKLWSVVEACTDSCGTITCNDSPACIGGSGCYDSCSADGECASGECLPFYEACRPADTLPVCEPCTSDADCGLFGDACIDIYADGDQVVERACSTACGSSADCPRAFFCDGGQCRPSDGVVAYHTCAAIRDTLAEKSCIPGFDQCGLPDVSDGTCNITTCSIGCFSDDDCPEGTTCSGSTLKFCKVD